MRAGIGAAGAGALLVSACMLTGESRTAQGQLYTSGNPTYDAFFRDVHQQQVDAASWGDDAKGVHKGLATNLGLSPDTADVTIIQVTHDSASKVAKLPGSLHLSDTEGEPPHVVATGGAGEGSGPFFHAIEDTAKQELDRARRLRGVEPKLDALVKQEADLETRVKEDFTKYGGTKESEVATELTATKDILAKLKAHAEAEARESEDFVADLGRALDTASAAASTAAPEDKRAEAHKTRPPRKREESAAAASSKSTPPEQQPLPPKPAPPPKPADTGEVFTP